MHNSVVTFETEQLQKPINFSVYNAACAKYHQSWRRKEHLVNKTPYKMLIYLVKKKEFLQKVRFVMEHLIRRQNQINIIYGKARLLFWFYSLDCL